MKRIKQLAVFGAMAGIVALTIHSGAASATPQKVISLPDIHIGGPHAEPDSKYQVFYSGNWSGYVAVPKSGGATSFNSVEGSYSVPSIDCSATPSSFSYHWVGLDGWTDGTVEQDGVADFCEGSTPDYFAWYEMYPSGNTYQFAVDPGDAITSSVVYSGSSGDYTLELTDQTTGQNFDVVQACPSGSTCDNSSAEAITEGYYDDSTFAGTSDFAEEHYDTLMATDSAGKSAGLSSTSWLTDETVAHGQSGDVDTQPGPLSGVTSRPAQSAFEDTWENQN